jgi:hypothetical protein
MDDYQKEALDLLNSLIKEQPNLISYAGPRGTQGENLAEFCAGFIQRYSENRKKMDKGEYRVTLS